MKVITVLISGRMGSGKTTTAEAVARNLQRITGCYQHQISFAEPLYQIHNFALGILKDAGMILKSPDKDRKLLQLLGTEWGRNTIGENVWVDVTKGRMQKIVDREKHATRLVFLISDCRFENEFDAFPDAIKIRLECSEEVRKVRCSKWSGDIHPSEFGLDNYAASSKFNLYFDTAVDSVEHISTLITAQILKA